MATTEEDAMASARPFTSFETLVQEAYIAYYGRPADADGLAFWRERIEDAGSLDGIIQAFGESEEFTQRFGELTPTELVTNLYQQLFNRDPEPAGLSFYAAQLETGAASLQSIAVNILSGAQNQDAEILANKVQAGNTLTTALEQAGALGPDLSAQAQSDFIADVGADPASLKAAQDQVDGYFLDGAGGSVGQVFEVTTLNDGADDEVTQDVSLREAIMAANQNPGLDKIVLSEGIHNLSLQGPDSSNPAYGDLVITDDLIIQGAGPEATVIDPGGAFRALQVGTNAPDTDVKVSGLTLQNGSESFGGAINNKAGLLLDNVRVTGNTSDNGGGINNTGELAISASLLDGNTASSADDLTGFGGAVWSDASGTVFLADSRVAGNAADFNGAGLYAAGNATVVRSEIAQNAGGGTGGGIDALANLVVHATGFTGNTANDGGALAARDGARATIDASTFDGNTANGRDLGGGGAVYNYKADVTVRGTTFNDNTAFGEGGGAIETNGALTLRDVDLTQNVARVHDETAFTEPSDSGLGGAVLIIASSTVDMRDVTVTDNEAGKTGGGIYNDRNTSTTLTEVTVSGNTAERDYGGGIQTEGDLSVTGGRVADNTAGVHGGGVASGRGTLTMEGTVIEGNSARVAGGVFNDAGGTVTLTDVQVRGNTATGPISGDTPGAGGGLVNSSGTVRLVGGEVSGNDAAWGGGISNNASQELILEGTRISDNAVRNEQFGTSRATGSTEQVPDGDAVRNFGDVEGIGEVEIVGVVLTSGGQVTGLPDSTVYDV